MQSSTSNYSTGNTANIPREALLDGTCKFIDSLTDDQFDMFVAFHENWTREAVPYNYQRFGKTNYILSQIPINYEDDIMECIYQFRVQYTN